MNRFFRFAGFPVLLLVSTVQVVLSTYQMVEFYHLVSTIYFHFSEKPVPNVTNRHYTYSNSCLKHSNSNTILTQKIVTRSISPGNFLQCISVHTIEIHLQSWIQGHFPLCLNKNKQKIQGERTSMAHSSFLFITMNRNTTEW